MIWYVGDEIYITRKTGFLKILRTRENIKFLSHSLNEFHKSTSNRWISSIYLFYKSDISYCENIKNLIFTVWKQQCENNKQLWRHILYSLHHLDLKKKMPRNTKENLLNRKSNVFGSIEYGICFTRQNTLRCLQCRR